MVRFEDLKSGVDLRCDDVALILDRNLTEHLGIVTFKFWRYVRPLCSLPR